MGTRRIAPKARERLHAVAPRCPSTVIPDSPTSRRLAGLWAITGLWVVLAPTASLAAPPAVERALISLEAKTRILEEVAYQDPLALLRQQLRRGHRAASDDPATAAALFTLALGAGLSPAEDASVRVELGRALAAGGDTRGALEQFRHITQTTHQSHHLAAAFEGYVEAAERGAVITELPDVDAYIRALSHRGALDTVAWETIYRLGRLLTRQHDRRADAVLARVPLEVPAGRRATYLRGVEALLTDARQRAAEHFLRAAEHPPYPPESGVDLQRDRDVVEMSWLAVGRLAFEAGDIALGFYAHQQIAVDSPRFAEAFYELGMLALDNDHEELAQAAFEPLIELGAANPYSRKAKLLQGYLLLQRGHFDRAAAYYEDLTAEFSAILGQFDAAVATIGDVADLARECDTRRRAQRDPWLAQVVTRPEVQIAIRLAEHVDHLRASAATLDEQRRQVDALLTGEGPHNPLGKLAAQRQAAQEALHELHTVATQIAPTASTQEPRPDEGVCCSEARLRARTLHQRLEQVQRRLERQEARLRDDLEHLRRDLAQLQDEQRATLEEVEREVRTIQREAAEEAIAQEREGLRRLMLEGETGVLQALWQKKEAGRDQIASLENERKRRIDQLYSVFGELLEDDDP